MIYHKTTKRYLIDKLFIYYTVETSEDTSLTVVETKPAPAGEWPLLNFIMDSAVSILSCFLNIRQY